MESPVQPSPQRQVTVLSLHGIRTRGVWQKQLTSILEDAGLRHEPLDYGFFKAIQLLSSRSRRRQTEWFRDEYTRACKRHTTLSIVAHSFGTYLVATAMERFPEIKFDRVILCGSIVRRNF